MREILLLCESVAVVLLAFLMNACLRRRSAAERHTVWVATFIALLITADGQTASGNLKSIAVDV